MHGNTRNKCELLVFIADQTELKLRQTTRSQQTLHPQSTSQFNLQTAPPLLALVHTPLLQPPLVHLAHWHMYGSVNLQVKIRTGPTSLAVLVDLIQVSPMPSRPQLLLTVLSLATLWTALSSVRSPLRVVRKVISDGAATLTFGT